MVTLETQEGSAYGAALLAMVGAGAFTSEPEACRETVREVDFISPRASESRQYARGHAIYQSLYPALRPVYQAIAGGD